VSAATKPFLAGSVSAAPRPFAAVAFSAAPLAAAGNVHVHQHQL